MKDGRSLAVIPAKHVLDGSNRGAGIQVFNNSRPGPVPNSVIPAEAGIQTIPSPHSFQLPSPAHPPSHIYFCKSPLPFSFVSNPNLIADRSPPIAFIYAILSQTANPTKHEHAGMAQ